LKYGISKNQANIQAEKTKQMSLENMARDQRIAAANSMEAGKAKQNALKKIAKGDSWI